MKETTLRIMAGEPGFEPGLPGPEPGVLPLDYSPATDVTESKSSPLPGLVNDILPLNSPQKRRGIGLLIQSQLPNPRYCLVCLSLLPSKINLTPFQKALGSGIDSLCNQKYIYSVQRCQFLKYQPAKADTAGILLASSTRAGGYNGVTDNGDQTRLVAPPTLRGAIPRSTDETDTIIAPMLSESEEVILC